MKKIYLIAGATLLSVASFAQSQAGKATLVGSKPYVHSTSVERAGDDTTGIGATGIMNYLPEFLPGGGSASIYGYLGGGYIFGNNKDALNICAQGYVNLNSTPVHIVGVMLWFAAKQSDGASSPTSKVVISAYNVAANKALNTNGSGTFNSSTYNSPGPSGAAVATADLLYTDIDTVDFNYVTLPAVATFAGDFAVGMDATTLAAGDTVGLVSDNQNDAGNLDYAFHKYTGKWYVTDQLFSAAAAPDLGTGGLDNDIAIWAVLSDATGVNEFFNGMKLTTYPNPSVESATIEYTLAQADNNVTLTVYDNAGHKIVNNAYSRQDAGTYKVTIETSNLAAGNYFYQLSTSNGGRFTKTFVVAK